MKKSAAKILSVVLALCIVLGESSYAYAASLKLPAYRATRKVFQNIEKTFAEGPADVPAVDGFTDEEVVDYFMEIAFSSEYENDRDYAIKYTEPVYYRIIGNPSKADLETLEKLCDKLNSIEDFPGIYRMSSDFPVDETIYFTSEARFELSTGLDVPDGSWGFANVSYYTEYPNRGRIAGGNVWISDEAYPQQPDRNSVICEEFIQALGLLNDPSRGYYSIFDQNRNDCSWPSDIDWAVIEILYSDYIYPGIPSSEGREAARAALKQIN